MHKIEIWGEEEGRGIKPLKRLTTIKYSIY
jgi:hypothetical protein